MGDALAISHLLLLMVHHVVMLVVPHLNVIIQMRGLPARALGSCFLFVVTPCHPPIENRGKDQGLDVLRKVLYGEARNGEVCIVRGQKDFVEKVWHRSLFE